MSLTGRNACRCLLLPAEIAKCPISKSPLSGEEVETLFKFVKVLPLTLRLLKNWGARLLASHRPSKSLPHEARQEPRPPDPREMFYLEDVVAGSSAASIRALSTALVALAR